MNRKTSLGILQDLVAINTVNPPGNELEAAEYLKNLLSPYGFCCEIQRLEQGRANFIGTLGSGNGPELMLCGHLDVVPASGIWAKNPFVTLIEEEKIYGRGVADMKGGIASMCEAAIRIALESERMTGILKLVFVADEEDANLGIRAYLENNPGGDFAIIGEPTALEVAVAHRGVSRDIVEIHGCARHAALAEDGTSAVSKLPNAIMGVERMNLELSKEKHSVLPPPGISVTMVNAYEKDNIVPGMVCLLTDFRIHPGMEQEKIHEFLREGLLAAGIKDFKIKNHFFMNGGELSVEDSFVGRCCKVGTRIFNRELHPQAFSASCEQCFLVDAGVKTIIFGPGNIEQAHTEDEFLHIEQLEKASQFYEEIIRDILR